MDILNYFPTDAARVRYLLFKEFGDEAAKAADFILSDEQIPTIVLGKPSDHLPDGVYFCLKDGSVFPYGGEKSVDNVDHIGIVVGNNRFGITLKDKGRYPLYKDWHECPEEADHYANYDVKRSCHEESDFIAATKRIQAIGTDIPLEEGEYLPLVRQFDCMGMFKTWLQEALVAAGGEPIDEEDCYWSASESSQGYAWYVHFSSGYTFGTYKSYGGRVRAVVAF